MVVVLSIMVAFGLLGSTLVAAITAIPNGLNPSTVGGGLSSNPALQEQQWTKDIQMYEEVVAREPNNAQAWLNLANARYDLGRLYQEQGKDILGAGYYRQSVEAYQKALEFRPDDVNARVDMATAAFYSNLSDEAEKNFKLAIEKDPKHLNAHMNYGVFLAQARQDVAAAKAIWQKALGLNPPKQIVDHIKRLVDSADALAQSGIPGSGGASGQPDFSGLSNLSKDASGAPVTNQNKEAVLNKDAATSNPASSTPTNQPASPAASSNAPEPGKGAPVPVSNSSGQPDFSGLSKLPGGK